jgi:hypothetical protein
MKRAWPYFLGAIALPGCSLLLDFSSSAAPKGDAAIDAAAPTAAECAYDEPNDTIDTAASVTTADMGPAAICATSTGTDDVDYYRFEVPAAMSTVTIQLVYQPNGATGDLNLALFDSTDSVVASETDNASTKTIACPSTTGVPCPTLGSGTYTFEVSPASPGNTNAYTFSLSIQ